MHIRSLSFLEYDSTGWNWRSEKIVNPAWNDVVVAVNRMDKFHCPSVSLFIGDNDEDMTIDCLTIMGGAGVYWVGLSAGKHDQLRLFDAAKSSNEVPLWTSDQGFSDYEFHTTNEVELVLRIAAYFGEFGEPLPDVTWDE